jgi:nucleoside-diphosphate-sugar epimerase
MINADLSPGTTIDLGTGHLTSVADVVRRIYSLVNQGGRPLIGVLPDRPGEEQQQVANAARSSSLISWQAAVPLNEGLVRLIKKLSRREQ